LNVFFTFYWWIFFTPYVEINSGFIVCGSKIKNKILVKKQLNFNYFKIKGNSFLLEFRDEDACSRKPAW
jgi:hypothetical protein